MHDNTEELKARVQVHRRDQSHALEISRTIHANPELAFENYESMALLTDTAERHGYSVEAAWPGWTRPSWPPAPEPTRTDGGPGGRIRRCPDWARLPDVSSARRPRKAALALQALRSELPGTFKLVGTPAEERGGGKVIMVERGVFDGIDAAMMIHPAPRL
ncbi:MAG: hypothetical protein R2854_24005 [Caldilineaceae bacterium]